MNHRTRATLRRKRDNLRQIFFLLIVLGLLSAFVYPAAPLCAEEGVKTHIVTQGESLSSIALRHGVSLSALIRANGIANPNLLTVGQVLIIPAGAPPANITQPVSTPTTMTGPTNFVPAAKAAPSATDQVLTVYAGETLSSLAARYGTTSSAIMARNGLLTTTIYVGQRLIIPVLVRSLAPVGTYQPTPMPTTWNLYREATPSPSPAGESSLILLPTAPPTDTPLSR